MLCTEWHPCTSLRPSLIWTTPRPPCPHRAVVPTHPRHPVVSHGHRELERKQVIFWFAWREKTVEWWPSKTFSVFQFSTGKLPLGRNGKLEKKENRERKKNKRVDWNHSVLKKGWWLFWPSYTWLEIRVQWHYMKRKRRRRGGKEKTRQRRGGST